MKGTFRRTVLWVGMTFAAAVMAFAAGQGSTLPEGEGKKIVEEACGSCHGLDLISGERDKDGWNTVVVGMRAYGAQIDDDQLQIIVDYLVKNFGPKESAAAQAAPTGKSARTLQYVCATCQTE